MTYIVGGIFALLILFLAIGLLRRLSKKLAESDSDVSGTLKKAVPNLHLSKWLLPLTKFVVATVGVVVALFLLTELIKWYGDRGESFYTAQDGSPFVIWNHSLPGTGGIDPSERSFPNLGHIAQLDDINFDIVINPRRRGDIPTICTWDMNEFEGTCDVNGGERTGTFQLRKIGSSMFLGHYKDEAGYWTWLMYITGPPE